MKIMLYKGYYGSIEYWKIHEVFHGSCKMINDKIYYEASDLHSLEREFKLAVDEYLEYCSAEGEVVDRVEIISLD